MKIKQRQQEYHQQLTKYIAVMSTVVQQQEGLIYVGINLWIEFYLLKYISGCFIV